MGCNIMERKCHVVELWAIDWGYEGLIVSELAFTDDFYKGYTTNKKYELVAALQMGIVAPRPIHICGGISMQ